MVRRKFGPNGTFRGPNGTSAWRDHRATADGVPTLDERAIAATTAYCEYVWKRYGRFPVHVPPFRCGLAHQAVHLDAEFYDRFYQPEALPAAQRSDFARTIPRR
jgi:hypothetical protein